MSNNISPFSNSRFLSQSVSFINSLRSKQTDNNAVNSEKFDPSTDLPVEVFTYILSFLRPSDLMRSILVNKYWKTLAGDPLLWKNLCLQAGISFSEVKNPWVTYYNFNLQEISKRRSKPEKINNPETQAFLSAPEQGCSIWHGELLAYSRQKKTKVIDLVTGACLIEKDEAATCLDFDSHTLITATKEGKRIIFKSRKLQQEGRCRTVSKKSRLKDSDMLHLAEDSLFSIWGSTFKQLDRTTFKSKMKLDATRNVSTIATTTQLVAVGYVNGSLSLWDLKAKSKVFDRSEHSRKVTHLDIQDTFLVVSDSHSLKVWDVRATAQPLYNLPMNNPKPQAQKGIIAVAEGKKSHYLSAEDYVFCQLKLWNIHTGEVVRELYRNSGLTTLPYGVSWTPDSLLFLQVDGKLRKWKFAD